MAFAGCAKSPANYQFGEDHGDQQITWVTKPNVENLWLCEIEIRLFHPDPKLVNQGSMPYFFDNTKIRLLADGNLTWRGSSAGDWRVKYLPAEDADCDVGTYRTYLISINDPATADLFSIERFKKSHLGIMVYGSSHFYWNSTDSGVLFR